MKQARPGVTLEELEPLATRTVLITGAGGMLGAAFSEVLHTIPGCRVLAHPRATLDVTDRPAVLALAAHAPDLILHCAADVHADRCEQHPAECQHVNVGGTENIIALARMTGARVVYPQSVFVFDGRELPVQEATEPNPLSEYGRTKLAAERLLLTELPTTLVIRMAGFFGGEHRDKNFVGSFTRRLFEQLARNERDVRIGERVWQPSYTRDLAENALLLVALGRSGIYNMGAHGEATFFEVAEACVTDLGLRDVVTMHRLPHEESGKLEIAPRPFRIVTANRRLADEGLDRQRSWRLALSEYLARPYFQSRARLYAGMI
jgi:dTDP-4-dehydrorhamnose reductase